MTDILTRVFGPDPENQRFPAFNEEKIIPFHTCEWVETRTWGTVWVSCAVCKSQRPEEMTREGL